MTEEERKRAASLTATRSRPATQGNGLGMDRVQLEQAATKEATRLGGGQATDESREQVIRTPYGVMSSRGKFSPTEGSKRMTQSDFEASAGGFQGFDRPERYTAIPSGGFQKQLSGADDRALAMARMAEIGGQAAAARQQKQQADYYAFRQRGAEAIAQQALTPSFGTAVNTMRGAQALAEAERWKQAQAGRSPMSREPLVFGGMSGPQPTQSMATPATTTPTTSFAPAVPQRSLGLTAESPLAFTPFGRTIGETPLRTPEIPPVARSPFPENVASSIRFPFGVPRFPYSRV